MDWDSGQLSDESLGRWRYWTRPYYVVYPSKTRPDVVRVLRELDGESMVIEKDSHIMRTLGDARGSVVENTVFAEAAREFWRRKTRNDFDQNWRAVFHNGMIADHEFVQDPDDIPGGCLVCWNRLEAVSDED